MTQSDVLARFDRSLTGADDAELIERVRGGDGQALGELYRRHAPAAVRAARALTGSAHDADDVVSEVFSAVWRAIRNGRGPTDRFEPYLIAAVKNRARMVWFNGSKSTQLVDQADTTISVDVATGEREPDIAVHAFVALNPREREMLWLTAVEGRSSVEAGEEMSLTRRAAATLKFRAKRSFAEAYLSQYAAAAGRRPSCRTLSPKLSSYVRGSCRKRAQMEVERHLATCASCSTLVDALADVNTTFRSAGLPVAACVIAAGAARRSWTRQVVASVRRLAVLKPAAYLTAAGMVTLLPAAVLFGTDRDVPDPEALVVDEDARRRPEQDEPAKAVLRNLAVDSDVDALAAGSPSWTRPRIAVPYGEGLTADKVLAAEAPLVVDTTSPSTTTPGTSIAPSVTTPNPTVPLDDAAPAAAPALVSIAVGIDNPVAAADVAVAVDESSIDAAVEVAVDELSIDAAVEIAVDEPSVDATVSATVPTPVEAVAASAGATVDPGSVSVDVSATIPSLAVGDVEILPEIPIDIELDVPLLDLIEPPAESVPAG